MTFELENAHVSLGTGSDAHDSVQVVGSGKTVVTVRVVVGGTKLVVLSADDVSRGYKFSSTTSYTVQ